MVAWRYGAHSKLPRKSENGPYCLELIDDLSTLDKNDSINRDGGYTYQLYGNDM